MTNKNNTINKTIKRDLCVSCGICKAVCPIKAIEMRFKEGQYIPDIDFKVCTNCGKCLNVCPGHEINYPELYSYKDWEYPEDIFVGNYKESYIAYVKDKEIRKKSTSGGVVTNLIIELLEKKIYQKAFVVKFNSFKGEEVKSEAVANKTEVINSAKSKYLPVSMENVVKYIKNNPSDRIIVVGTSCHFHGINKFLSEENLNDDNILFLGLFCEKTLNFNILNYYEDQYAKDNEKIKLFHYRNKEDEGWPGNTKIEFDSGRKKFIDRRIRMWLKPYFQLNRCLFCIDKLNQFADISFGDCYISGEESYLGKSNIIIRTKKGKEVLKEVKDIIEQKKVETEKIVSSQKLSKKKYNLDFDRINDGENINKINLDLKDFDQQKYKRELHQKYKNIEKGKYYEKNEEFINSEINKQILMAKLNLPKKLIIRFLDIIGIKDLLKKIIK